MARDFLLEIGTEEIPARFMRPALQQLQAETEKIFRELRLNHEESMAYGTPRRLAILVRNLDENQGELFTEAKGPAKKVAFDEQGAPTKAAQGFARGQGVAVEDLIIKDLDGVEYVFAVKRESGAASFDVLSGACRRIVESLSFPKPMRWGDLDVRFARPIRWLAALYGGEVIPFTYAEITADRYTRGHRFLGEGKVALNEPLQYLEVLEKNTVNADPDDRKEQIWTQVLDLAEKEGGVVIEDAGLLEEVNQLVEWPQAIVGIFDESYLKLPKEVLITPMREHQRYFPVEDGKGNLLPRFIAISNGYATEKAREIIREGNEKVLRARLADAKFFYEEDLKTPLADRVEKLGKVVFQEKLGTVLAKVERIRRLSAYLSGALSASEEQKKAADRAAYLCKADLVTNMVYEFPELQGSMGREYALKNGEPGEVAEGVYEHYLPRFAGDELPESMAGKIVSLADKIDTIVGCFAVGIKPTGSQDPYALRRQAIGTSQVILTGKLPVSLDDLVRTAFRGYGDTIKPVFSEDELAQEVREFFAQRLNNIFLDRGLRYDVVDAVLAVSVDNFADAWARAQALASFRSEGDFDRLLTAFTRAANLAKKAIPGEVSEKFLEDPAEKELWTKVQDVSGKSADALAQGNPLEAFRALAVLREPVDNFFEKVMVMVDDENIKNNRLALLAAITALITKIADFSLLAPEK